MQTSLDSNTRSELLDALTKSNAQFHSRYSGERTVRQPVHTVYGGAHLFNADVTSNIGKVALTAFERYAAGPRELTDAFGVDVGDRAASIYERVKNKLVEEPVEDFRIDFEDGYGLRPDAEEDGHAIEVANQLVVGMRRKILPPFVGVRIKALDEDFKDRALRTLDIVLTNLLQNSGGVLPANFVVTLPKIQHMGHVEILCQALSHLEQQNNIKVGSIQVELMTEQPQIFCDPDGRNLIPALVAATNGRCRGLHFGTFDYTSACGVHFTEQSLLHPACDLARLMMQIAAAETGIWLSDSITNVMPIGPHREKDGKPLSQNQIRENRNSVHNGWQVHVKHILHALRMGFYQGWDVHPAQLPARYLATYAFMLAGMENATKRLKSFLAKATQATLSGDVFDDVATAQGLLNSFVRALNCGAIGESEIAALGLTNEQVRSRSFVEIVSSSAAN